MNLLFLGPPGSGKGTQAQYFSSNKKLSQRRPAKEVRHISTGDIFRRNLRQKTALGQKAQQYIDEGALVPDEVTIGMVEETLKNIPLEDHIIFDGFPRSIPQAKALDKILKGRNQKLDLVIFFEVPDSVIVERLSGRLWAPKSGRVYHLKNNPPKKPGRCDETGEPLITRKDDQKEVIASRLKAYRESTLPLLEYYKAQGAFHKIDGRQAPDELRREIFRLAFSSKESADFV